MKEKFPLFYLLEIPCEIVLFVIVVEIGTILNNMILGEEVFPFLAVTVLLVSIMGLFFMILMSIVNFVKYTIKRRQKQQAAQEALQTPIEPERKK